MMKRVNIILSIISVFSFNLAYANHTVCKSGTTERTIDVVAKNDTGIPCEVRYTKDGETQTLWNADNSAEFCENKADGLVEKLSGAGWNCTAANHDHDDDGNLDKRVEGKPMAKSHGKAKHDHKACKDKNCKCEKCSKGKKDKSCKKCAAKKHDEAKHDLDASKEKLDKKSKRQLKKEKRKAEKEAKKAEKKAEEAEDKLEEYEEN